MTTPTHYLLACPKCGRLHLRGIGRGDCYSNTTICGCGTTLPEPDYIWKGGREGELAVKEAGSHVIFLRTIQAVTGAILRDEPVEVDKIREVIKEELEEAIPAAIKLATPDLAKAVASESNRITLKRLLTTAVIGVVSSVSGHFVKSYLESKNASPDEIVERLKRLELTMEQIRRDLQKASVDSPESKLLTERDLVDLVNSYNEQLDRAWKEVKDNGGSGGGKQNTSPADLPIPESQRSAVATVSSSPE